MSFHRQWIDPEIIDSELKKRILVKATYLTLAVTDGLDPYAVPISYVYDVNENSIYFHCATIGKKISILRKNPHVWCLAVIDKGLGEDICQNLYASIMFSGEVTFLENIDEKVIALQKQIQRSGGDVDRALNRLNVIVEQSETIKKMTVGRISIGPMTGKRSTSLSEEKLRKLLE